MKTEKNILIAFILNISFSIFELFGGIFTNSVAIISDSIHDLGDAISIGIAYFLEKKSKRKPDENYTYGYQRYSCLGAVITNTILITGSILVIYNAILRLLHPVDINYDGMIIFSLFGIIINFLASYITKKGESFNQKAVSLHMMEDVLGWVIVFIGSIVIKFTSFNLLDSILSILVAFFILINATKSFKEIFNVFLEKTPNGINISDIKKHLMEFEHIKNIHHIHVWSIDGINNYATMHVVTDLSSTNKLKSEIKEEMHHFGINHTTIEFEGVNEKCDELECFNKIDAHHHHHHH